MSQLTDTMGSAIKAITIKTGKYLTFSLAQEEYGIGILKVKEIIGIVVDAVSEVLNIKEEEIEASPSFGTELNTDYILGMAKIGGGVKILLDIDRVLSTKEIQVLEKTA